MKKPHYPEIEGNAVISDPYGTRTRVAGVKGRSPRPLDERASVSFQWNWTVDHLLIMPRRALQALYRYGGSLRTSSGVFP